MLARTCPVALATSVLLLTAGCGGSDSSGSGASGPAEPTSDPCRLLTLDEVAAVMGTDQTPKRLNADTNDDDTCQWEAVGTVTITVTKDGTAGNQTFIDNSISSGAGIERISGTGKVQAYYDPSSSKVTVWSGGAYIAQAAGADDSDKGARERNETMGRLIAKRLAT